jgi:anti-anti-sigma factor
MDLDIKTLGLPSGGEATVVIVTGELDVASSERLGQLAENADTVRGPLLIDLSDCSFLDSVAVGRMMRLSGIADASGSPVQIAVVAPHGTQLGRVLGLAGAEGALPIYETRDGALASLGARQAQ